ncbi:MAG: hypothetical protein V2I26_07425, partial [Halieaceae bacterium]|nr:hypothetical protein [Halieaceae bacterium]
LLPQLQPHLYPEPTAPDGSAAEAAAQWPSASPAAEKPDGATRQADPPAGEVLPVEEGRHP